MLNGSALVHLKEQISFVFPELWMCFSFPSKTGFTALHVAAHYGQLDFVRDMLTRGLAAMRSEPPKLTSGGQPVKEQGSEVMQQPVLERDEGPG